MSMQERGRLPELELCPGQLPPQRGKPLCGALAAQPWSLDEASLAVWPRSAVPQHTFEGTALLHSTVGVEVYLKF